MGTRLPGIMEYMRNRVIYVRLLCVSVESEMHESWNA